MLGKLESQLNSEDTVEETEERRRPGAGGVGDVM